MSEIRKITAEIKDGAGKGAARRARAAGRLPAIIYGNKETPVMITVDPIVIWKFLNQRAFYSTLVNINLDGKEHQVLPRSVAFNKVSDQPIHVDFMRVNEKSKINVAVPIQFINEEASPGIKRGAVLNVVRHTIDVICNATNIPASFTADLTGLGVGESIHFSKIEIPEGVEPVISDRDFTVATLTAPSSLRSAGGASGDTEESEESTEESAES